MGAWRAGGDAMTADVMRRVMAFVVLVAAVLCGPVLFAQVADVVAPAASQPASANEWGGTIIWAFFSTSGLEWLKRHPQFSLISERTAWGVQRVLGVILAIAAALGVHYTYDPAAGRLIVDGLVASALWTTGVEAARQWVINEVTYRVAVKNYGLPQGR